MKLSSIKHYKITTSLECYNENIDSITKIKIYNLQIYDDLVVFYTNQFIEIEGFIVFNQRKTFLKRAFLSNVVLLFIILSVLLMMFVTPYYIKEVKYKDGSIVDEAIYCEVVNYVKNNKKLDLRTISKELMIRYSHYSWIELKKQGRVIYLYIELNQIINNQNSFKELNGDLISGYDAYIKSIIVRNGKPKIDINQTVKKGDLLISGNLNNHLLPPNGEVIGEIVYTKEIKVQKCLSIESYSGEMIKYKYLKIGNLNLKKKKHNYLMFKTDRKIVLNLVDLFYLINESVYEIKKYDINHTSESALNYVISYIHYEMEKNRTSVDEKILSIDLLKMTETDNEYVFKMLVKADKNIIVFRQY